MLLLRSASSLVALAAAVGVAFVQASLARAATISVSNTAQLQAAVIAAESGDTIVLAAGTYSPTAPLEIAAGITGLTIQGPQNGPGAVLSGLLNDSTGTQDILDVDALASVTVKNISFRDASFGSTAAIDVNGSLDLENSYAEGPNLDLFSKPLIRVETGGTAVIRNSTINSDDESNGSDVGVENSGGAVQIFNSTITGNNIGIITSGTGTVELTNTIVAGNNVDCDAPVTSSVKSFDTDGTCGLDLPSANPQLDELATNGGSTLNRAPLRRESGHRRRHQ